MRRFIGLGALTMLIVGCSPSAQKFLAADWSDATYNEMSVIYFFEDHEPGQALYVQGGKNFMFYKVDLETAIAMAKKDLMAKRCGSDSPVVIEDMPASTGPHRTIFVCQPA